MTLKEYYKNLSPLSPRAEFINQLVTATGRDKTTIIRWINGVSKPQSKLEIELIAKLTSIEL